MSAEPAKPSRLRRSLKVIGVLAVSAVVLLVIVPWFVIELFLPKPCLDVRERREIWLAICETYKRTGAWPMNREQIVSPFSQRVQTQNWSLEFVSEYVSEVFGPTMRYHISCGDSSEYQLSIAVSKCVESQGNL